MISCHIVDQVGPQSRNYVAYIPVPINEGEEEDGDGEENSEDGEYEDEDEEEDEEEYEEDEEEYEEDVKPKKKKKKKKTGSSTRLFHFIYVDLPSVQSVSERKD